MTRRQNRAAARRSLFATDSLDVETIALDAQLSRENELRDRLEAAIADNAALHVQLQAWKQIARKWERRHRSSAIDQPPAEASAPPREGTHP